MSLLPQTIADLVSADGLPRAALADDGILHVLYLENEVVRSMLASEWPGSVPTDPTPAQSSAARAARAAARLQAARDAVALRAALITAAQSCVGVTIDNLTLVQLKALLAVLLWRQGALTPTTAIRPLGEWIQ